MAGQKQRQDRIRLDQQFTTLPNHIVRDKTLSIGARGMLGLIVSMADDWKFYRDHMMGLSACGKDKYYSLINELKQAGRLHIEDARDDGGTFGGRTWHVNLSPCAGFPDTVDCDKNAPCPDLPDTENTDGGKNRTHKNTNLLKKKNLEERNDQFDQFLKIFPKPRNPVRSREAFDVALDRGVPVTDLMRAAQMFADQEAGNDKRYVTGSDTWLQDRCWEDQLRGISEPKPDASEKTKSEIADWVKATAIKEKRSWVASGITQEAARRLIAADLVTLEECRAAGIRL